jgi:hypothetical protein
VTRDEWTEAFAHELGLAAPSAAEVEAILQLAATAAHASERTAAPVAAWLAGCSGRSPGEAGEAARRVAGAG